MSLLVDFTFTDKAARWCTISAPEQKKCESMKMAFADEGLSPAIMCVNRASREVKYISVHTCIVNLILNHVKKKQHHT